MFFRQWKPQDNIAGITQIIDSFIYSNKASSCYIDACLSVSLSALKELVLQKSGRAIRQKGRRGLSIHEETGEEWAQEKCVKGKELQNATITRDLCSRARPKNLQMLLATFSRPSTPPSRFPALNCKLLLQLQSGVSLGERKLRELHCARTLLLPPKFIREDASVPP